MMYGKAALALLLALAAESAAAHRTRGKRSQNLRKLHHKEGHVGGGSNSTDDADGTEGAGLTIPVCKYRKNYHHGMKEIKTEYYSEGEAVNGNKVWEMKMGECFADVTCDTMCGEGVECDQAQDDGNGPHGHCWEVAPTADSTEAAGTAPAETVTVNSSDENEGFESTLSAADMYCRQHKENGSFSTADKQHTNDKFENHEGSCDLYCDPDNTDYDISDVCGGPDYECSDPDNEGEMHCVEEMHGTADGGLENTLPEMCKIWRDNNGSIKKFKTKEGDADPDDDDELDGSCGHHCPGICEPLDCGMVMGDDDDMEMKGICYDPDAPGTGGGGGDSDEGGEESLVVDPTRQFCLGKNGNFHTAKSEHENFVTVGGNNGSACELYCDDDEDNYPITEMCTDGSNPTCVKEFIGDDVEYECSYGDDGDGGQEADLAQDNDMEAVMEEASTNFPVADVGELLSTSVLTPTCTSCHVGRNSNGGHKMHTVRKYDGSDCFKSGVYFDVYPGTCKENIDRALGPTGMSINKLCGVDPGCKCWVEKLAHDQNYGDESEMYLCHSDKCPEQITFPNGKTKTVNVHHATVKKAAQGPKKMLRM